MSDQLCARSEGGPCRYTRLGFLLSCSSSLCTSRLRINLFTWVSASDCRAPLAGSRSSLASVRAFCQELWASIPRVQSSCNVQGYAGSRSPLCVQCCGVAAIAPHHGGRVGSRPWLVVRVFVVIRRDDPLIAFITDVKELGVPFDFSNASWCGGVFAVSGPHPCVVIEESLREDLATSVRKLCDPRHQVLRRHLRRIGGQLSQILKVLQFAEPFCNHNAGNECDGQGLAFTRQVFHLMRWVFVARQVF